MSEKPVGAVEQKLAKLFADYMDLTEPWPVSEERLIGLLEHYDGDLGYPAQSTKEARSRIAEKAQALIQQLDAGQYGFEAGRGTLYKVNVMLQSVRLPTYNQVVGALSETLPYLEAAARGPKAAEFPRARAYNLAKLVGAEAVIARVESVIGMRPERAPVLPAEPEAKGYVLAFPGASAAEAEELITTLRLGGNTVVQVQPETAAAVLSEVISTDDELQQDLKM